MVRTHCESLSGVAIEGILDAGQMTVVKCGGRRMERYFVSEASLLECTDNPNMPHAVASQTERTFGLFLGAFDRQPSRHRER